MSPNRPPPHGTPRRPALGPGRRLGHAGPVRRVWQLLWLLLAGLLLATGARAGSYTATSTPYSWDTVSTDALLSGDDVSTGLISLPFSFVFAGTTYSGVYISSNGLIAFTGANNTYTNAGLPSGTAPLVGPYWDDLRTDKTGAKVYYGTLGTAPNRRFVVTWSGAVLYANNATKLTFQAVLFESGNIEFRYNTMGDTGSSATIGVQATGTDYTAWSVDTAGKANAGTAVLFYGREQSSPGGLSPVWWSRAGTVTGSDGAAVATWVNMANYSRNLSAGSTAPVLRNNNAQNINFNPVVEFSSSTNTDAAAQYFSTSSFFGTSTWNQVHIAFVGYPTSSNQKNWLFSESAATPSGASSGRMIVHLPWDNDSLYWYAGSCCTYDRATWSTTSANYVSRPNIYLMHKDATSATAPGPDKQGIRVNGVTQVTAADSRSFTGNSGPFYVGRNPSSEGTFRGVLAEGLMFLGSSISATQANQLESYLGLKYGSTLGGNGDGATPYRNSAGTVVWAAGTGFHNNVAGLGRDDTSKLDQRISRSANSGDQITVTTSATMPATATVISAQTGTAFGADKSFVITGDNAGTVANLVAISSGALAGRARSGRLWRLQTSGTVPTQFSICIPDTLLPASFLTGTIADLQLNIASDTGLSSNVASYTMSSATCPATGSGVTVATAGRLATVTSAALSALAGTGYFSVTRRQLDHVEITTTVTTGVTCQATTYTVKACGDSSCSTLYTGGLSGSLSITGTGITVVYPAGAGFSIASGSSSATVQAQVTSAGTATVGAAGLSVTPGNSQPVFCGLGVPAAAGNACSFTSADSGFLFDVPNHRSAVAQAMTITAIKKSGGTCGAAFSGLKSVSFKCAYANPSTGTLPVLVGGTAVNAGGNAAAACDATGSARSLVFDTNGQATTTAQYNDAGQVSLTASYVGSGADAGLTLTGTDSFVVAPSGFTVSGTPAAVRAGQAFSLGATAVNALGNATPNFGRETVAEKPLLSFYRAKPSGSAAVDGLFTAAAAGSASGGAFTFSGSKWTEVGRAEATLRLSSGNYLSSGLSVAKTTGAWTLCAVQGATCTLPGGVTATVLFDAGNNKFTYRHGVSGSLSCVAASFAVDPDSSAIKSCSYAVETGSRTADAGTLLFQPDHLAVAVTDACSSFTYAGQPFGVSVSALNAAGNTTLNYDGTANTSPNFARTIAFTEASGNGSGSLAGATMAATAFTAGVGSLGSGPAYGFTAKLTSPQTITLRATDTDGISSSGYAEGSANLRSGRLVLSNAFGSDKLPLQLPIQLQYWSGKSWVLNSADACTTIPTSAVLRPLAINHNGTPALWTSAVSSIDFSSGTGSITLAAPSPSGTGSLDITVHLGSGAALDQSCLGTHLSATGAGLPWLRSRAGSCAATWDRDPSARATFGVYAPETRRSIHLRELF